MMKKKVNKERTLEEIKKEFRKAVNQIIDEEWEAIMEEVRLGKRSLREDVNTLNVKGYLLNGLDDTKEESNKAE